MAYIPKEWKDLPDETTPIQASDLNHIEQGIGDLNTSVGDLNALNTTEKSNLVGAINEINSNVLVKKVWENSNTTSAFVPQTISVPNLDEADFVLVTYYFYTNLQQLSSLLINATDGTKAALTSTFFAESNFFSGFRTVNINVSEKNINFENGVGWRASNGDILNVNDWTIPYQIYLIKIPTETNS